MVHKNEGEDELVYSTNGIVACVNRICATNDLYHNGKFNDFEKERRQSCNPKKKKKENKRRKIRNKVTSDRGQL